MLLLDVCKTYTDFSIGSLSALPLDYLQSFMLHKISLHSVYSIKVLSTFLKNDGNKTVTLFFHLLFRLCLHHQTQQRFRI